MTIQAKHQFGEIDGTRVTFVEKKVDSERKEFLMALLEHNGFEVVIKEEPIKKEGDPQLYTVAVTDMVFNPVIWIYQRRMRTPDGKIVTPAYWEQRAEDTKPQYWEEKTPKEPIK